ncbi:1-phosphofructokinase family hexose kinase, partial [Ideonella sp. B508-1]|uniref:1-phosphofructokinase family hexose kinase n=1 Tax=Ideonella sp. B508-1 TaxID=137716 RepID=UPI001F2C1C25
MNAPRLFTITLNPAIDQTVRLDRLLPGEVHRALGEQTEAGGKGIGVAAVLAALGRPVTASGWLGADNDAVFRAAFAERGISDGMLRLPGATRTNIKLAVAERGDSTDINLPGLALAPEALQAAEQALGERLDAAIAPGDWCELAGSLPPGTDAGLWERLARRLGRPRCATRHRNRRRGAGHAAGPGCPTRPAAPWVPGAFLKPNRAEAGKNWWPGPLP